MLRTALLASCFVLLALAGCSAHPASETPAPVTPELHTLVPTVVSTGTAVMGCSVLSAQPTQAAAQGLPPVTSSDYVRGPANASVTMLAYCDFQSASCEVFNQILDQLQKEHPNDLRVVLRPVPAIKYLQQLDKTQLSVQALLAAGDMGKFWEMREQLVSKYADWVKLPPVQFQAWAASRSTELGLDGTAFKSNMMSGSTTTRAKSLFDKAAAMNLSIPITFLNGSLQPNAALSYDGLDSTIGLLTLASREFKTCPPFGIDPSKQYTATLHTEKGDVVMQLYADKAPLAVNSFVFLAQHGWFDGVTFHRVLPGFLAQTGDPSGTGQGGPGYYFKSETSTTLQFNKPGVVALANAGPDTNGSQFFITYAPQPTLDGKYTIFGQVIKGMDVVESLTPRNPDAATGLPPGDKILSITIQEQ